MRKRAIFFFSFAGILILGLGAFVLWGSQAAPPTAEALAALQTSSSVRVIESEWLEFHPALGQVETGFIFYPGGRVDPRAYAPAANALAQEGFLVVIVPMPLNLAVFGAGKASQVMGAFPEIQHWAVGGHSLGGAMAANYARQNAADIEGLVLWAAYPASSDDLTTYNLQVVSIYGTLDGLADPGKIEASRALLPASTNWVAIEGGNHAQFGWYGPQTGDNPALISPLEQQAQVIAATWAILNNIQN